MEEPLEEEVDVEAFAKEDRPVPRARRYRIRIDRERYVVEVAEMMGREILALAGKTPETHQLSQKLRGGAAEPIRPDEVVSFRKPGVERFMTVPREQTEG